MGKILFMTMVSAVAGALAWVICEPFAPTIGASPEWANWEVFFISATGACIGCAIGGFSGYAQGSRAHLLRGLLLGLVLGFIGAIVGYSAGTHLSMAVFGDILSRQALGIGGDSFFKVAAARTLFAAPLGAFIGLTYGLGSKSVPRAIQGFIGGAIGGAVGGMSFDTIANALQPLILGLRGQQAGEIGSISRGFLATSIGAGVGLFAGVVEALSKKAWVRLELGRNEGKEWIVDASRTFIGRSETAHIPLFGDPNVMPMHACISRDRGQYQLLDGGSPMGIGVNGMRVPSATLNHGDVLNIGSFQLRFLLRNPGTVSVRPPDAVRPTQQPVAAPLPTKPVQYSLVALDGPMTGTRLDFGIGELVAGREGDWLNLSFDASASRKHAAFVAGPNGVHVRDLGSTNGTIINGTRVQEMMMRAGDTVRIGETSFRLEA